MADTREVFDMITRTRPDDGALERQHRRQRRRRRNERTLVFALAAVIVAGTAIGVVAARRATRPASSPTPPPAGSTRPALQAIDVATGQARPVASDVAPYRADISPDGTTIAFVRLADGEHPQIFVRPLDGSGARQVTGLPGQPGCGCGAIDPDWSPDGTRIAFSGLNLHGGRGIYVVDVETEKVRQVTHDALAGEAAPSWSPDGTRIAFERGAPSGGCCGSETTGGIWIVDVADGSRTKVVAMDDAASPTWSPDGRWIAFSAIGSWTTDDLWLVRPDGSDRRLLVATPSHDTAPAWSPDGSSIAFDQDQTLALVDVSDGTIRSFVPMADPAWSADGRELFGWHV